VNIPTTPSDTVVPTRRRPTTPADVARLAALARVRGVEVFLDAGTGRWFATSATDANACHRLTAYSCDCQGFTAWGRCSHHAALLDRLGWLPAVDTAPTCRTCHGRGFDPDCAGHPTADGVVTCECEECDGGQWNDDLAESAPDDSSRFAMVAARYPAGHAA